VSAALLVVAAAVALLVLPTGAGQPTGAAANEAEDESELDEAAFAAELG
jgi:hypothetical protein